jgi:hypothetical protein
LRLIHQDKELRELLLSSPFNLQALRDSFEAAKEVLELCSPRFLEEDNVYGEVPSSNNVIRCDRKAALDKSKVASNRVTSARWIEALIIGAEASGKLANTDLPEEVSLSPFLDISSIFFFLFFLFLSSTSLGGVRRVKYCGRAELARSSSLSSSTRLRRRRSTRRKR